jgi:tetratricopeptide (TPR) repeat protein
MSFLRLTLAGAALLVAAYAIHSYRSWRAGLDELTATAETLGLVERRPGLLRGMERDADNDRAALRLARAILAEELDQSRLLELSEAERAEERRRGLERLDIAHELGLAGLRGRTSSWEAHLVVGGSNYLRFSRRRDPRLAQERELWLGHLEEARRLAPSQPEPLRFLAATRLGSWSVLSAQERAEAVTVLEAAFRDPASFDLLGASWLRVAPTLDQALAIVPDDHRPWDRLKRHFRLQGDWERYCLAQHRFDEALGRFMRRRLEEAGNRLRGGDRDRAIEFFSWVGANSRPDAVNVDLIEAVLAALPAGSAGEADRRWLEGWLDWSLERCLDPSGCPLSESSIRRLLGLARDVPAHRRAWALAAAGDLSAAEAEERHAAAKGIANDPDWTPYLLTKARLLSARGEFREALRLFDRLPAHEVIRSRQILLETALAAGDPARAAEAREALEAMAGTTWSRHDWTGDRRATRLELLPATAAPGLRLRLLPAGDSGALAVLLDGSTVGIYPANRSQTVDLELPIAARRHLVEIRPQAGARAATAEVTLLIPPQ